MLDGDGYIAGVREYTFRILVKPGVAEGEYTGELRVLYKPELPSGDTVLGALGVGGVDVDTDGVYIDLMGQQMTDHIRGVDYLWLGVGFLAALLAMLLTRR